MHRSTSASTSSSIPNQPMDVETSDNVPTDPEAMPADGDLEVTWTTANNACHEFADAEMVLEDHDPEGWEDVESDTSDLEEPEGGNNDHDSEDDFGDIYE